MEKFTLPSDPDKKMVVAASLTVAAAMLMTRDVSQEPALKKAHEMYTAILGEPSKEDSLGTWNKLGD